MLTQVMLVGVGGSGGKTLRVMRQTLLRRLREKGWQSDELPKAWQMLWIDTITTQVADGFAAPPLPNADYLGLVADGVTWPSNVESLVNNLPLTDRQSALSSWLPRRVPINIQKGAGMFRTIGRGVAVERLNVILAKLNSQYATMTSPAALMELQEVSRLFGYKTDSGAPSPFAVVLSSIAGGSGAGMFLDIAEVLKSVSSDFTDATHSIVYGPDVFNSIPPAMAAGIPPNVLGAISEITSGVRSEGMGLGSQALFRAKGALGSPGIGIGGRYNYLMGASNQSVSFGSQDEVYRAVGDALTPLIVDENIQDWMNSFVLFSVFAGTGVPLNVDDRTRLRDMANPDHKQIFASLGFSRVGLGMDRFGDYLAEVLARESVTQLLWPKGVPQDPQDPKTNPQLIDEQVDAAWPAFLNRSGLNERNPANDVVAALAPADTQSRCDSFAASLVAKVGASVGRNGMNPADWASRLMVEYNSELAGAVASEAEARYEVTRNWSENIQDRLVKHISEAAALYGIRVTVKLIDRLRDELRFVSTTELPVEAAAERRHLDTLNGVVNQALNGSVSTSRGLSAIQPGHPAVYKAQENLSIGLRLHATADRLDLASVLLVDLEANLLAPLQRSLADTARALEDNVSTAGADGAPSAFETWPTLSSLIPPRLMPGVTEKLLIDATTYPTLLETLTRESVGQQAQAAWRQILIQRTICGVPLDETGLEAKPNLIAIRQPWIPGDERARWIVGISSSTLGVQLPIEASEYIGRSRKSTVEDRTTALGKFVIQDLETYLATPDVALRAQREAVFASAVSAAIDASGPMAQIDPALLPLVHPGQSAGTSFLSSTVIPSSLKNVVDGIIATKNFGGNLAKLKYDNVSRPHIEFFQVLQKSYHPMVFKTLMEPIAQSWAINKGNPGTRESWWSMRRSRPLTESLPVTADVMASMVQGWFTSRFLNLRQSDDPIAGAGPRIRIANENGEWKSFPHPLLAWAGSMGEQEQLPCVLQSLGIALVECSTAATLAPLEPYWELIRYGKNHEDILGDWVRHASSPANVEKPLKEVAGSANADPAERRAALLESLTRTSTYFNELFGKIEASGNEFAVDQVWELRDVILTSLAELQDAVSASYDADSPSGVVV